MTQALTTKADETALDSMRAKLGKLSMTRAIKRKLHGTMKTNGCTGIFKMLSKTIPRGIAKRSRRRNELIAIRRATHTFDAF